MNLSRTLIAATAVATLCGCVPNNQSTSSNTSPIQNVTTQPQVPEQKPQYLIPILLGKSKQEILNMYGTPDEINNSTKSGTNGPIGMFYMVWNNKPVQGFTIKVGFEEVKSIIANVWDRRGFYTKEWQDPVHTTVQYALITGNVMNSNSILAKDLLPGQLTTERPTEVLWRGKVNYEALAYEKLLIIWRKSSQIFATGIVEQNESLMTESKTMNTNADGLIISHQLSDAGNNWLNRRVLLFAQYHARDLKFGRNLGPMENDSTKLDDYWRGLINISF